MNESQLWQDFKSGNRAAFEQIFLLHHRNLFLFGKRLTPNTALVDDTIQEMFLEFWQSREQLADVTSVKGYLFRALKFKLLKELRREAQLTLLPEDATWLSEPSFEHQLIDEQQHHELKERIHYTISLLTKRQQEAISLRFQRQMSYDEIATTMDISYQAVVNIIYKSIRFPPRTAANPVELYCDK